MKRSVCLFLISMLSFMTIAADIEIENYLSEPDTETVTNMHTFCIELHSEFDNPNIEEYVLNCVNNDLEASAYQLFTSYTELKSFIELKSGEQNEYINQTR